MDIYHLLTEKKIERVFRARNKIIAAQQVYHVTQRAPGRELLFVEAADYEYFIKVIQQAIAQFDFEVYAYALMRNHVHMLVRMRQANLHKAMGYLFQRYAIYFNKKYKRKGHVFSGAFRCALCNSDRYCLAVSVYIHMNPVKARLVKRPDEYLWSSYQAYRAGKSPGFVAPDFILSLLSDAQEPAQEQYRGIVEQCISLNVRSYPETRSEQENIFQKIFSRIEKHVIGKKAVEQAIVSLAERIQAFQGRRRLNNPSDRQALAYVITQLQSRGFTNQEIAGILRIGRYKIYRMTQKQSMTKNVL